MARFPDKSEETYEEHMAEIITQFGIECVDGEDTARRYIEVDDDYTPRNISLTDHGYHWVKAWVRVEEAEIKEWLATTKWESSYE